MAFQPTSYIEVAIAMCPNASNEAFPSIDTPFLEFDISMPFLTVVYVDFFLLQVGRNWGKTVRCGDRKRHSCRTLSEMGYWGRGDGQGGRIGSSEEFRDLQVLSPILRFRGFSGESRKAVTVST